MISLRYKTKTKRRFSVAILSWMILISIIPICLLGFFLIIGRINQFNKDADKIKTDSYTDQSKLIKNRVDEVIQDIDFGHKIIHQNDSKISLASQNRLEEVLKHEMLVRLSNLKFGKEGYVFVNTTENKALIYDGHLQTRPIDILKSGMPEWIANYQYMKNSPIVNQGGFFEYTFKKHLSNSKGYKVAYVRMYKQWGWLIGAGVYFDEINKSVNIEKDKLKESIKKDIFHLALIIVILIFSLAIIYKMINLFIHQNINAFKKVYSKAADDFTRVDLDKINYDEFRDLACSANRMIVERNQFFDELNQEKILLRTLIDTVPNLIFYKDKESRYLGCNHAFALYMGYDESEIIGHTEIDLFSEEKALNYLESDRLLLKSKTPFINEELNTYPDGRQVRFETTKTFFNDVHGNIQGIIGISHDITARYEMEEQLKIAKNKAEESNRLKTAFLANMSHEIRTPLNAILGFSNLLVYDDISAEEKETYSRLISQSGNSLASLVNDIVDMAKIESGQVDVEKNSFDVNEAMTDLFIMYRERVRLFESDILIEYDPDPQHTVLTLTNDVARMKQILMNLLNNALKFSTRGVIKFGYRVESGYCNFFVSDQGIGIAEQNMGVIFDAFTQVDGSYSRQYGGVGLGLSISKQLIALMGGQIWVESKSGVGSTFTFNLPID